MIDAYTEDLVCELYTKNEVSVREIIKMTGVRSEQTIYSILARKGIAKKRRTKLIVKKISINLEPEAWEIVKDKKNISEYINDLIKHSSTKKVRK